MEDMGNYGYTLFRTIPKYAPFKKTIQHKSYGITAQSKPLCGVIP